MIVPATPAPLESAGTASTAMTVSASLDSQVGKWLPWKRGLYSVRVKSSIFPGRVLPLSLHVLVLREESGRGGDGGRSQLCSGDPHCGWEGTGSMAGAFTEIIDKDLSDVICASFMILSVNNSDYHQFFLP